jgi:hypothetical protein
MLLAPVPPFASATTPVTLAAVPEVFWFSVGISLAAIARNAGAPAVANKACVTVESAAVTLGGAPVPPPSTTPFAASTPDEAHVAAEEKYGIPPLVPATVNAGVVVGEATEIKPPLNAALVTVPLPAPFAPGCPARLIFQSECVPDPPVAVTLSVNVVPE